MGKAKALKLVIFRWMSMFAADKSEIYFGKTQTKETFLTFSMKEVLLEALLNFPN